MLNKKKDIIDLIKTKRNILLLTHKNPDGDAVGSVFAFAYALNKIKDTQVYILFDGYNSKFDLISNSTVAGYTKDGVDKIDKSKIDLVIVLDCADTERLGKFEYIVKNKTKDIATINIDHHVSNKNFGNYNFVLPDLSSTCEIVYEFINEIGLMDEQIASALYAGIVTDTGGFRHSCTSSKTHAVVSELLKFNIAFTEIYNTLLSKKTYEEARLLAIAINNLEIIDSIAVTHLTLGQTNSFKNKSTSSIIDYIKNISGVSIALVIIQIEKDFCKFSLRSDSIDVNKIAKKFNGGGHKLAAGGVIKSEIYELKRNMMREIIIATGEN